MSDKWLKCEYCGCGVHADTIGGDIKNHNCKDRQIANLTASRDRWRELAAAQKVIIAYEHRDADYGINAMIQAYADKDKAISALKEAGEWED